MAGSRTIRTSWQKYLPRTVRRCRLLTEGQDLGLEIEVTECLTGDRPTGRQAIEILGAGQLGRLDRELCGRAADHDGEVIRRARRGAQRLHLVEQPRQQGLLVEQRLGLLEQVALVGATTALRVNQTCNRRGAAAS